jgi:hypothetical protein
MFSFLKRRREVQEARGKIGTDLHRQIRDALRSDDLGATKRLSSAFTVGYIYSFIRDGFFSLGVDAEKNLDSHIRFICNGVIPGKLFKIYSDQTAALTLAREMKDQEKEILNLGLTPSGVLRLFTLGARSGSYDAPLMSIEVIQPDNLRRYLLDEPLKS